MEDLQQPLDPKIRRKKLDELFSDEPYLSPTMKARSLYQKLEMKNGESETRADLRLLPDLPPPPEPRLYLSDKVRPRAAETTPMQKSAAVEPPRALRLLGFFEAIACLRQTARHGKADSPEGERLRRFRENVLLKWLPAAPKRERTD